MRYIEGRDRHQRSFLPPALEDFVGAQAMVRVVDAFVGSLDMGGLGFRRSRPARTGRPGYDPRDLLALYLYGYANDVRSSRRLEQECRRNVEVMWLLHQLTPDFKTIADFRKDNGPAFVAACRAFVAFCLEHELVTTRSVVLDGSKFQAVASPKRILDRRRLEQEMARLDAEAAAYLAALDAADAAEEGAGEGAGGDAGEGAADPAAERARIEAALAALDKRRRRAADKHATVTASGADKTVETEPEATVMGKKAEPKRPAYNVQIVVDPRTSLIVHHAVTDHANDVNLLHAMASATKQDLGLDRMIVIADAGYSDGAEAAACEADGITPCVPPTRGSNSRGDFFDRARFTYDPSSDTYTCPNGRLLRRHHNDAKRSVVQYRAADKDCAACPLKPQCTNAQRRSIRRHLHDPALARMAARVAAYPGLMRLRRSRVEHPFGTIKRRMGGGRFLLKGLQKTGTETALAVTAYNLRRLTSIIGSQTLITKLAG